MDQFFIIRTHRDGTITELTADIESIITKMGISAMTTRNLGKVAAVVEKVGGTITKSKLRWGPEPAFKKDQEVNAQLLLDSLTTLLKASGGGDDDIKVVIRSKM